MADTSPHAPLDPSAPWDSASLGRVAAAASVAADQAAQASSLPVQLGHAIARLTAIRELHQPVGMYDECDCDDKDADGHVVFDEIGRTCNRTHQVCRACCITSDDVQSEDCADRHDHTEGQPICATAAALDVDLDSTGGEPA